MYLESLLLHSSTTQAATIGDTNETTLWSYTLPANTLRADGRGIRVTLTGTLAANANTKTISFKFGGTIVVSDNGSINSGAWKIVAEIVRKGVGSQVVNGASFMLRTLLNSGATLSFDETTALALIMTAQNGTANANDVVFTSARVELI